MNKFLKITTDKLEIRTPATKQSEIVKNPIPILLNYKGFYGWIPIEIVKNEIQSAKITNAEIIIFTWQQAFPLRQDVGKMLEELDKQNKEMLVDLAIIHEDTNLADNNKLETFIEHNKIIRNRTKKYENLRLNWHA